MPRHHDAVAVVKVFGAFGPVQMRRFVEVAADDHQIARLDRRRRVGDRGPDRVDALRLQVHGDHRVDVGFPLRQPFPGRPVITARQVTGVFEIIQMHAVDMNLTAVAEINQRCHTAVDAFARFDRVFGEHQTIGGVFRDIVVSAGGIQIVGHDFPVGPGTVFDFAEKNDVGIVLDHLRDDLRLAVGDESALDPQVHLEHLQGGRGRRLDFRRGNFRRHGGQPRRQNHSAECRR
ncbi:hypothetical protein SDC9_93905 [bioreactor metagenome]|uniref:Uncharacterized protein n=1 Tax=bioreactor metagenome TaxID=1076179 RepID=A0A645A298_9ZZZZ